MSSTTEHDPYGERPDPSLPDTPYDASSRAAVKEKARKAKKLADQRNNFMAAMLDQPEGRAWLAYVLFDVCGLMAPTDNAAFDTNGCHFKEGARAVGLLLQKEALTANREQYIALFRTHLTVG